jgi:hypothetical protein
MCAGRVLLLYAMKFPGREIFGFAIEARGFAQPGCGVHLASYPNEFLLSPLR